MQVVEYWGHQKRQQEYCSFSWWRWQDVNQVRHLFRLFFSQSEKKRHFIAKGPGDWRNAWNRSASSVRHVLIMFWAAVGRSFYPEFFVLSPQSWKFPFRMKATKMKVGAFSSSPNEIKRISRIRTGTLFALKSIFYLESSLQPWLWQKITILSGEFKTQSSLCRTRPLPTLHVNWKTAHVYNSVYSCGKTWATSAGRSHSHGSQVPCWRSISI